MTVRSSKTGIFNMQRQCSGENVSSIVYTGDQSIKNQPVLWVIHGSGGVSSSEDIFLEWAKKLPVTIVIVDSYTGRKVFKHNWDGKDGRLIDSHLRAEDIVGSKMKFDKIKDSVFPFASNKHYAVGFSDGATTAIRLLTERYSAYTGWLEKVFCLYPAVHPYESDFNSVDGSRCQIFVGEDDNWTPADRAKVFAERTGSSIEILKDTHHSFFKPGVKGWHNHVINISSVDFPELDSDYLRENFGKLAKLNNIDVEQYRGVYAEYSEESCKVVLNRIEKEILNIP